MIFYTRSCAHLSNSVGLPSGSVTFEEFNGSELRVQIHDEVARKQVVVCASTSSTESWFEMFFLIDALMRAGAFVNVLLVYCGYGRQDKAGAGQSSGLQVMQRFLGSFASESITVIHAHTTQAEDALVIGHQIPFNFFNEYVQDCDIIVAPDHGAQGLVVALAAQHQKPYLVLNKVRLAADRVHMVDIPEIDIRGKRCLIIDDMIATGTTVVAAADVLSDRGAYHVAAAVTHGLFVGDTFKKIEDSPLAQIFVTNTIHHEYVTPKISVVDLGSYVRQLCKEILTRTFFVCMLLGFLNVQAQVCFKPVVERSGYFVSQLVIDALDLNYNLFSCDSAKIITGFVPFYLLTRVCDETIQCNFYDPTCHKNINQFPQSCHTAAKVGVGIPMVFLSSLALFGWDDDIQYTGRMTAIGLPFVHSGKDIIKQAQARACLRPWHEDFGRHKRSSGGFPSGHMANVMYMATLWGLRHGPRWAVPLGFMAVFVFADFVNQNRHYVSQMVAGAALGVLYGVAANRVVENRLCGNLSFSVVLNDQAQWCGQMGCSF